MFETFFGFKKTPFALNPDPKQLFESQAWTQLKSRLQFLIDHRGMGLLTGEVGSGKSTCASPEFHLFRKRLIFSDEADTLSASC